jgi:hypothetical protein
MQHQKRISQCWRCFEKTPEEVVDERRKECSQPTIPDKMKYKKKGLCGYAMGIVVL